MPAGRGARIGVLSGPGWSLDLFEDDALWMGRMLVGEEGSRATFEAAHVLVSVLLRRFAAMAGPRLARGQAPQWSTITDLLRAWSQPLQERQEATEHRMRIRSLAWTELSEPIRRAVLDTMTGRVPLWGRGTGAIDAAAPGFVRFREPDWRLVDSPAASWVWSTAVGRAAPEPTVVGGQPWAAGSGGLVLLGGALILAAVLA